MSINVFRRIVEILFRHWPIYAALFVAFAVVGALNWVRTDASFTSSGTIFVDNESLVTTQSGVQSSGFYGYLSPAQFTSQELNGLLQTDVFMDSVLNRADVTLVSDPVERDDQVARLRAGMSSFASSENLVQVDVTASDPDLAFELAAATIAEFVQFQIGLDVAESGASEDFFSDLALGYEQDLEQARQAVDAALRGVGDESELTLAQELQLERLREAEARAEARYRAAAEDIEVARLAKLQTETDVRQSYSTFDPPQRPTEADEDFLQSVPLLLLVMGGGAALALAWPIAAGFTDRTILFSEDLAGDVTVLGLIPSISNRSIRLKNVGRSDPASEGDVDSDWVLGSMYERAAQTTTFIPPETIRPSPEHPSPEPGVTDFREVRTASQAVAGGPVNDPEVDRSTRAGFDDTSVADLLDAMVSSHQQPSPAPLPPMVDTDWDADRSRSAEEQPGVAEPEPPGADVAVDDPESPHRHTSGSTNWAPSDEHGSEERSFVVVDTTERPADPDEAGRDHGLEAGSDAGVDGGGVDAGPGLDPSTTTEIQTTPGTDSVFRPDDPTGDQGRLDDDQQATARTHHA